MKNLIFIVLFSQLVYQSCKKDEPHTIVEGIVVDYGSGLPIDSALVSLQSGVASGSPMTGTEGDKTKGNGSENIAYTDKYGRFKVELTGEQPFIFSGKKGYFAFINPKGGETIYPVSAGSHTKDLKLRLKAKAYFNPYIKSTHIHLEDDTIIFEEKCPTIDSYCDKFEISKAERYCSTSDSCYTVTGNDYFRFKILYQINGIWNVKIDSVYVKAFTVYKDTIWY